MTGLNLLCVILVAALVDVSPAAAATSQKSKLSSSGNAPASLVIAKLLSPSVLRSAGLSASGVEDDGGAQQEGMFMTQAGTTTSAGTFLVDLATYQSNAAAKTVYKEFAISAGSTPRPLTGAGDQATTVNLNTYVRRGSQILTIKGQLSAAANTSLAQAKASGSLDQSTIDAANAAAQTAERTLATAVGHRLSGQPLSASGTVTYFPPGSVNPCSIRASSLNNGDIHVTSQPTVSDTPPSLECVYTFTGKSFGEPGTGQLAVYTLTDRQAAGAVPPTTVDAAFSATGGAGTQANGATSSATDGSLSANGTTAGEPNYAALATLTAPPDEVSKLLIRVSDQASSYRIDVSHCSHEIAIMFDDIIKEANANGRTVFSQLGPAGAAAAKQKVVNDILDWCDKEARGQ
jgi:hypothetical protein